MWGRESTPQNSRKETEDLKMSSVHADFSGGAHASSSVLPFTFRNTSMKRGNHLLEDVGKV